MLFAQGALAQDVLTTAAITEAEGEILFQIGDEEPQPLRAGQPLRPGMTLITRPGASATIVYPDGQIIALGEGATLRNTNYRFDPKDPANSAVNINLISGNMRVLGGEISLTNPGAVRIQVGTATLDVLPSARNLDASIVVQGGSVAMTLQGGTTRFHSPLGQAPVISAGQGLYMGANGAVNNVGSATQILQFLSQLPQAPQLLRQMAQLQGFDQKLLQTAAAASSITEALKSADIAALLKQAGTPDDVTKQILSQLAQLPPSEALAQLVLPAFFSSGTPSSNAAGGGSFRPATPN